MSLLCKAFSRKIGNVAEMLIDSGIALYLRRLNLLQLKKSL